MNPFTQNIDVGDLGSAQKKDDSLTTLRQIAQENFSNTKLPCFYLKDGILLRAYRPPALKQSDSWSEVHQVVLPQPLRKSVLELAHDGVAGHLGIRKTYHKITQHYFWPNVKKDVINYVNSCHECQMVGKPNKPILPAPLHPIPITSEPFRKIVIDCVGPLPRTKKGNQYLLTVMDTATRYPEVYPLKTISSKNIIRCLTNLFTHFVFPEDIQSDRGSNFTSNLFKEVLTFFSTFHMTSLHITLSFKDL